MRQDVGGTTRSGGTGPAAWADGLTERLTRPSRHRRTAAAAVGVLVLAALVSGGSFLLGRAVPHSTSLAGSAPGPPDASASTSGDPRTAFRDPALLALAAPYLDEPDVTCEPRETPPGSREVVGCRFPARAIVATFRSHLSIGAMWADRSSYLDGSRTATRDMLVSSARWQFLDRTAGTKTRASGPDRGEGVRAGYEAADGTSVLYFDQDSSAAAAVLSDDAGDGLDPLLEFWAGGPG